MLHKVKTIIYAFGYSFCNLIATHPYIYFGIGFSFHLFIVIISFVLQITGAAEIFRFELKDIPLVDRDYFPFKCYLMDQVLYGGGQGQDIDFSLLEQYGFVSDKDLLNLYYDSINNNILVQKTLKKIREFEENFFEEMVNNKWCVEEMNKCQLTESPIQLFLEVNPTDTEFEHINATLTIIYYNATLLKRFSTRVSKDFQYNNSQFMAKSLHAYVHVTNLFDELLLQLYERLRNLHFLNKQYFNLYFENRNMMGDILLYTIKRDSLLIIGCFLYIFIFTGFQTKSVFVTCFGILSILTSVFIANFFYSLILGIKFLSVMHILSIFLILGIGCDNIYVFFDKWKSNQSKQFKSLTDKLSNTYQDVGWSIFITSATTAMAFFILFTAPLLLINSFGLFVAIVVVMNYISVLVYFPVIVIIYSIHFENVNKPDRVFLAVTRFFGVHYYQFLMKKYVTYIILGIFGAISITALVFNIKIKSSENFPHLLVSGSILDRMEKLKSTYFNVKDHDTNLQIAITSGIRNLDFSVCSFWNFSCQPLPEYDSNFKLNNSQVQIDYQNICNQLINADEDLKTELSMFNDTKTNVFCFMTSMDQYFKNRFPTDSFQCPWNKEKFQNLVNKNRHIFGNVTLEDEYPVAFESAMYYFLSDGFNFTEEGRQIFHLVREAQFCKYSPYIKTTVSPKASPYGHFLNLSKILINITIYEHKANYYEKREVFDKWIKWHDKIKNGISFNTCISETNTDLSRTGYFHWVHVQTIFTQYAIRGVIYGLVVACPILFLATMNFFTFCIILLSTCLSTITTISIIPLAWDLGLLESMSISIVVGMSIDFIVHMGLTYNNCDLISREEKTQYMLQDMAISILSGMITTLGSAFFLFFCQVNFLFKFGVFVFVTITSAGLYSLIFLPCLLLVCGPTGDYGKIRIAHRVEKS